MASSERDAIDMMMSNGGPPVARCPSCKSTNICGHVEHDVIAWWDCFDCKYEWPRGQWSDPNETEATGYVG